MGPLKTSDLLLFSPHSFSSSFPSHSPAPVMSKCPSASLSLLFGLHDHFHLPTATSLWVPVLYFPYFLCPISPYSSVPLVHLLPCSPVPLNLLPPYSPVPLALLPPYSSVPLAFLPPCFPVPLAIACLLSSPPSHLSLPCPRVHIPSSLSDLLPFCTPALI